MYRADLPFCVVVLTLFLVASPGALAQRPLTEVDRELLEQRIEALERRLDDARGTVRPLTEDQLRPVTEQVRRLDEKIDGRTWAFSIVIALALAFTALAGFLLNYFGRPALVRWIQQTVEDRATAEVQERVRETNISTLVQEQAKPGIESAMAEMRTRTDAAAQSFEAELLARKDALAATSTPSPEQTEAVSEMAARQRQDNPNPREWSALDWVLNSQTLIAERRFADALVSLDRALELEPDSVLALSNRGFVLNELARYADALVDLDRSLELEPDDPVTLSNRGFALNGLGQYDEALAAFDRSLELRPNDPVTLSNRGSALSDLGRYDEALVALDRSLELRPDDPATLNNRGLALSDLGRYDEALVALDRSLELRPDDPVTLSIRGVALNGLGRHDEALAALDRSLELAPDNPVTLHNRGVALNGLGRYGEALAAFDRAFELAPDNPVTLHNRGWALNELGRHDEALAAFDRSIEIGPAHPAHHSGRSRTLMSVGDGEEALRAADKSLALADEAPLRDYRRAVALYYRAVALRMLGHSTEEAEAALDDAMAIRFKHSLGAHLIDPTTFDDPEVGAFVDRLNDTLRAHDAARDL